MATAAASRARARAGSGGVRRAGKNIWRWGQRRAAARRPRLLGCSSLRTPSALEAGHGRLGNGIKQEATDRGSRHFGAEEGSKESIQSRQERREPLLVPALQPGQTEQPRPSPPRAATRPWGGREGRGERGRGLAAPAKGPAACCPCQAGPPAGVTRLASCWPPSCTLVGDARVNSCPRGG